MSASLRFAPMSLAVLDKPFDHDGFIYELKYDGPRARACRQRSAPPHFPQPQRIHDVPGVVRRHRPSRELVPDGEIVYLSKDGCPRFYDLIRRRAPQHFYALAGLADVRRRPYKNLLERTLPSTPNAYR